VARWHAQTEAAYPAGAAEYAGLAEGLGVGWDEYAVLVYYPRLLGASPQCTVAARCGADGVARFSKTDDIEIQDLGMNVLEITRPDAGYAHLHLHFAGTPWSVAGMNQTGFAMGMTGIPGPAMEADGLLSLLALHTILPRCATVDQAVDHVRRLPVTWYGFSLMIGDATGAVALLEKSGAGMSLQRLAGQPFLAHTNHVLDPQMAAASPEQAEPVRTNGRRRLANARARLEGGARLEDLLRDRSASGAVCQRGEDGLHTDFGVLFEPERRIVRLWAGYPDEVEEEILDAAALLG
ncbi:MAG: C45 family peptidase, partial [Gemmatimonadota bacterium]